MAEMKTGLELLFIGRNKNYKGGINMKCTIIRDLLPSYVDGLTSEDSNQEIANHMESCEACREYLASMRENIVSEQYMRSSKQIKEDIKPFKKYKEHTIFSVSMTALVIVVGIACIIGLLRSPKSLEKILPKLSQATAEYEMHVSLATYGIEEGEPYIDFYNMSNVSVNSEAYNEIMQIIESSEYRNDLKNYLPWDTESETNEPETDAFYVYLSLLDQSGDGFSMMFEDDELTISENNSNGKDKVYNMTEVHIFTELVEYVKENGTLAQ